MTETTPPADSAAEGQTPSASTEPDSTPREPLPSDPAVTTQAELDRVRAELDSSSKLAAQQLRAHRLKRLRHRSIVGGVAIVLLVVVYLVAAAFLPRWWAQRIADQVHGSFSAGVLWGLFYGSVFTFFPLMLGWQARRRPLAWKVRTGLIVAALVLTIPNLLTLSVAIGVSSAATAGDQILDVFAPAFRGATLVGVILGALLAVGVAAVGIVLTRRRAEVKTLRAQDEARLVVERDRGRSSDGPAA